MRAFAFYINLLSLLLSAACQVKEKTAAGGLISGHTPTTNSFTLQTPASQTLVTGEIVSINVTFPFAVTVTGTPQLALTIGATTQYANYLAGNGTTILNFQYTIVGTDNDTDGITVASLGLNGGALTFDNGGISTNCTVASLASKTFIGLKVDNTSSTISNFSLATMPGHHHLGQTLNFILTFSEPVYVTGSPRFAVSFSTGGASYATYATGSGSTTLSFTYVIGNTFADINGFDSITSPLDLNAGTILDAVGNASALVFSAYTGAVITYSALVGFDGRVPYIASLTAPANATYTASQNLDFTVAFDRAVTVTGTTYIDLTIGVLTRQAAYLSGSGTNLIIFRYTTIPGDVDADGITISNSITQNAGDIVGTAAPTSSYFLVTGNNTLSPPLTTGVKVNAPQPQAITVARNVDSTAPSFGTPNPDNVWNIGQDLLINVGFNTNIYVNQTSGTPRIPLTIGGTTVYATYLSGGNGQTSLLFRYLIQEGDLDTDTALAIGDIDLNGGTIVDTQNTNTLLTLPVAQITATSVDGVRPQISTITSAPIGTYSTVSTNNHLDMTFIVNWTEAVNFSATTSGSAYLTLDMGGVLNNAQYSSGNNTAAIAHNPGVLNALNDNNGVVLSSPLAGSAIIKDRAGNTATDFNFASPDTTAVLVDTVTPLVSSITPPANSTFIIGQNLNFALTFSESVTTNKIVGYPRVSVVVGASTKYLEPVSNGTGLSHTFRYTVVASDLDTNGVAMGNVIGHSGLGYVRDVGENLATTTFIPSATPAVLVDGVRPTVTLATASANKTYLVGENIDFTFTYSENVNITGSPRLTLTVGATTRYATYFSGSASNSIVFRYTVPSGDEDTSGIAVANTIDLNSGTIKDIPGNAQTNLTFTSPILTSVKVDGVAPTIGSITPPASSTYGVAANLDYTFTFSEAVTIIGTPNLSLNVGGVAKTASYLSGSGSTAIIFRYTTITNDVDTNGVQCTSPLLTAGGSLKDAAGNNAVLTYTDIVHAGVLVDGLAPQVSSVTVPADGAYQNAGTLPTITFIVNYNKTVTVVGTPRMHLLIGSTTRYANYVSGTGTSALTFSYTVAANDLDLNGIAVSNSSNLDLNGGTMKDTVLNNANLALGALSTARITAVYPSMRNWYDLSDTASLVIVAGPKVTTLNDRISTLNLAHSGTGDTYTSTGFNGSSSGFATCASGNSFDSATSVNTVAILAVFKSPTTNAGYLYWSNNIVRPLVEFSTLNEANLGDAGGHYSAGAFGSTLTTAPNFWTSSSGNYYVRAIQWDTPISRSPRVCDMNGQLAEFIMFSTVPTPAELTQIESYISAKHGGLALP